MQYHLSSFSFFFSQVIFLFALEYEGIFFVHSEKVMHHIPIKWNLQHFKKNYTFIASNVY